MKLERVDCDEYCIVESPRDLRGWEVVEAEPWKDGVKRLHARRSVDNGMEFRLMYCGDSILNEYRTLAAVDEKATRGAVDSNCDVVILK